MRQFLQTQTGELHNRLYGEADGAMPLVMLHGAPGSGSTLVPLAELLARGRKVHVPDLPGMGDSEPLAKPESATVGDYADAMIAALDSLQIQRCFLHGLLSGARIAVEVARRAPERVAALVLEAPGRFGPEQVAEMKARYAPTLTPDIYGGHLWMAWHLCRDQYLFYPWYSTDADHNRGSGLPAAELLHAKFLEICKSLSGFPVLFSAILDYDLEAAVKDLRAPVLATADVSELIPQAQTLAFPPQEPLTAPPDTLAARAGAIEEFLVGCGD